MAGEFVLFVKAGDLLVYSDFTEGEIVEDLGDVSVFVGDDVATSEMISVEIVDGAGYC